jgi:hypothetical protein
MTNRFANSLILIGFGLIGFWLYGIGRTMRETVGFTASATFTGLVLGFAVPLGGILIIRLLFHGLSKLQIPWKAATILLCACALSEGCIIRDEARFAVEASKANTVFSRDRAWPNQACSLVSIPGRGIHATD